MKRLPCTLLATLILTGCSPDSAPRPAKPPALQDLVAATQIIGPVDDPQALEAFLLTKAVASRGSPPATVVARTVDGVPIHPRITVVYMSAPEWCGSGGCTLFVLVPSAAGLTELARATLIHPPVLVLDTRTNGMPDIAVGIRSDYRPGDEKAFVVLQFDGRTYASNPTVPPARPLRGPADGEIAISPAEVAIAFGGY